MSEFDRWTKKDKGKEWKRMWGAEYLSRRVRRDWINRKPCSHASPNLLAKKQIVDRVSVTWADTTRRLILAAHWLACPRPADLLTKTPRSCTCPRSFAFQTLYRPLSCRIFSEVIFPVLPPACALTTCLLDQPLQRPLPTYSPSPPLSFLSSTPSSITTSYLHRYQELQSRKSSQTSSKLQLHYFAMARTKQTARKFDSHLAAMVVFWLGVASSPRRVSIPKQSCHVPSKTSNHLYKSLTYYQ